MSRRQAAHQERGVRRNAQRKAPLLILVPALKLPGLPFVINALVQL